MNNLLIMSFLLKICLLFRLKLIVFNIRKIKLAAYIGLKAQFLVRFVESSFFFKKIRFKLKGLKFLDLIILLNEKNFIFFFFRNIKIYLYLLILLIN
jgi:hypothetical protein